MARRLPSWYADRPKKNKTRSRDYLAVEKFRRGNRRYVGVFKRRVKQVFNGKIWVTREVKRLGIKSYTPFRSYKPLAKPSIISNKNWSFRDGVEKYAEKIVAKKKIQMLRVTITGRHGGKRRVLTSYIRFSPRGRGFLQRSGTAQQREYVAGVLSRAALNKIRSLGYSSSPESKRNLEAGDSKQNSRFFVQSIRVDSVK